MAFRNKGLVLSTQRIEVQEVTARHKVPCCVCRQLPTVRRLVVQLGTGRSHRTDVFCGHHGVAYLDHVERVVERASGYLVGQSIDCVRLPEPDADVKKANLRSDLERRKWTTRDKVRVQPGDTVHHPAWKVAGVVNADGTASSPVPHSPLWKVRECYADPANIKRA